MDEGVHGGQFGAQGVQIAVQALADLAAQDYLAVIEHMNIVDKLCQIVQILLPQVPGVPVSPLQPEEKLRQVAAGELYQRLCRAIAVRAAEAPTVAGLAVLHQLGVAHLAQRNFAALSGGEQQLVLIARALCQQSELLIMDEPTASLDYGNQLRVLEQVRSLSEQGYTVLLSTHDPQHALRFSRRVLALQGGRVAAEGDTRSVLTPDLIRQLYGVESVLLDTPDGAALLPVRGGDRHV